MSLVECRIRIYGVRTGWCSALQVIKGSEQRGSVLNKEEIGQTIMLSSEQGSNGSENRGTVRNTEGNGQNIMLSCTKASKGQISVIQCRTSIYGFRIA